MLNKIHRVDLCIVGGGLSGMCVAIAAARKGVKVALMQDRPVLGGNASSEIRMWVCGAHGKNNRETGILEEINLENRYRNPQANFSIWDSVLYGKVRFEPDITLLLNCSCNEIQKQGNRIKSVKGWQLTTETTHTVEAKLFADCSGDSILAPLSGAEFRIGREAKGEFNESIAPANSDKKTMGMSCLIQARETAGPQKFIPPKWAYSFPTDADFPKREHDIFKTNFWWIEVGGENDTINDTEQLRDELLKIAFGVWDHIKNHGDHGAENWVLDWVGFLPGKRESRRYVGDYTLTQNDILHDGKFDDIVAYGGWSMDDHFPEGFYDTNGGTIFHPAPSPFGIPYRCLYSANIENLYFAGRNISATHTALSATRVMATCATLGQAVGTAAAIAVKNNLSPREVYENKIQILQQSLMKDDCYLPWQKRQVPRLSRDAKLSGRGEGLDNLRNGFDRPNGKDENIWIGSLGDTIEYSFSKSEKVSEVRFIFDSDLNRNRNNGDEHLSESSDMRCIYPLNQKSITVPETIIKSFRIEGKSESGIWKTIYHENNNYQRLVNVIINDDMTAVRFIPEQTWGSDQARVFSWDVYSL